MRCSGEIRFAPYSSGPGPSRAPAGFFPWAQTEPSMPGCWLLMAERMRPAADVPRHQACQRLHDASCRDQLVHMRARKHRPSARPAAGPSVRASWRHIDWLCGEIK